VGRLVMTNLKEEGELVARRWNDAEERGGEEG
jgi:hypothetical protein